MDELEQKLKERDALEGAYGSFVEPYVTQQIEIGVDGAGFYCVAAWVVLTVLYCGWVRSRRP
ncbi:hypothetical protein [Spirulina major]|uniref:hypothetical protein n=1 Tax=Spirulina major TaxID=270636 RepID=UPI00093459CA|nr:hypothetical protein [Spirulina major]